MVKKVVFIVALALSVAFPVHAERNYVTVAGSGGVPLNVATAGDPDNPAIVFIHGLGQSHYSFIHQLESDLTDDFYLVAFDLRGHGESGKPWNPEAYTEASAWAFDVAAVMTAFNLQNPTVVAWSYGGFVLMDYIREFGTANLAAVNFAGTLGGVVPFRMPDADDPKSAEFLKLRLLQMSPDFSDKLKAANSVVDWLTAGTIAEPYRQVFVSVAFMLPAYARTEMWGRSLDHQDLLEQLQMPVLLSMGSEDNPAMLNDAAALQAQHKNMSLSLFTGAGHSVFFENPQQFNAELRQFAIAASADSGPSAE